MKLVVCFISALAILPLIGHSQDTARLKRTPYKLIVAVDKNAQYEQDIAADPYMLPDNSLQLYPGETVFVEVEQDSGVIKTMTAVKENAHPEKTLIVAFKQVASKRKHEQMMLSITNPFAQTLVYKAKMFLIKSNGWVDTDVLPVEAKLMGFETWPNIIISIALGGWKLQAK